MDTHVTTPPRGDHYDYRRRGATRIPVEHRQPVRFTELGRVAQLNRSTVGRDLRVLDHMGRVETGGGETIKE